MSDKDDEKRIKEEQERLKKFQEEADKAAKEIARKIQQDEIDKKRKN